MSESQFKLIEREYNKAREDYFEHNGRFDVYVAAREAYLKAAATR